MRPVVKVSDVLSGAAGRFETRVSETPSPLPVQMCPQSQQVIWQRLQWLSWGQKIENTKQRLEHQIKSLLAGNPWEKRTFYKNHVLQILQRCAERNCYKAKASGKSYYSTFPYVYWDFLPIWSAHSLLQCDVCHRQVKITLNRMHALTCWAVPHPTTAGKGWRSFKNPKLMCSEVEPPQSLQLIGFISGGEICLIRYVLLNFMSAESKGITAISPGISVTQGNVN